MNKDKQLKRQQKIWYAKLKKEGFKDIEYADGSLKGHAKKRSFVQQQATQEYYYLCYHFLHEYKFDSELERIIWEYHTNGLSARDIAVTLKKAKIIKLSHQSVWIRIKRHENIMKSKYAAT
jgi:IS30 family transposase